MEKIASIPTVQFLFKSDGHKLRSTRFNVNFYCHDDVFVGDMNFYIIFCCHDGSKKNVVFCTTVVTNHDGITINRDGIAPLRCCCDSTQQKHYRDSKN